MKLTQKNYFIYDGKANNILQMILERNLSDFILLFKHYKIRNYDANILNIVKKKILENPFDDNIMDKVDCILEHESKLSMTQIIKYEEYLKQFIQIIKDKTQIHNISISKTYSLFIDGSSLLLLYTDVKSISENFVILDAIYNMTIYKSKKDVTNTNVTNIDSDINVDNKTLSYTNIFDSVIIPLTNKAIRPTIFYLILIYFNKIKYTITNNNKLTITIDELIPKFITYRNSYILSLLTSINMTQEEIKFNCNKITNLIYTNQYDIQSNKPILAVLLYINLLYFLKFIYNTNPDQLLLKYETWLTCIKTQTKLFNYYMEQCSPELKDKICIEFTQFDITSENIDLIEIKNTSENMKHLISIDQEKFLELVFTSKSMTKYPKEFVFYSKKIINIKNFINNNDYLLSYIVVNNKITTELYNLFINYLKDENVILYNKKIEFNTIMKMFNLLKTIITSENFKSDEINTLNYYIKLITLIPSSNNIEHTIFIQIIFHILIPYYNDLYNTYEFEDQLLI